MVRIRGNVLAALLACVFVCDLAHQHAAAADAPTAERVDRSGDPLPAGAVARMGTTRLRHIDAINGVCFHPDGKTLISAGDDGDVILWDVASGRRIRSYRFGGREIKQLDVSPDGRRLLVVDSRGSLIIAETETGHRLYALSDAAKRSAGAVFSPQGSSLALITLDGDAQLWRIEATGLVRQWTSPGDYQRLVFSPDGNWLAAAEESVIRRFSTTTGKPNGEPLEPELKVRDFDVAKNGKSIAACLDGGAIQVWNIAADGKTARPGWRAEQAHGDQKVLCVRFSPDGTKLFSSGYDQLQRIWNASDGRELRRFSGRLQYHPCWSPDGKTLATWGGGAVAILLRDADTGQQRPALPGHLRAGRMLQFLDGGRRLATVAPDDTLRVWDIETGEQTRAQSLRDAWDAFPIFGTSFVFAAGPEGLSLLDVETGKVHKWRAPEENAERDAGQAGGRFPKAVDADEKRLLTVTLHPSQAPGERPKPMEGKSELTTWRLPDGERIGTVGVQGEVKQARLLPDGKRLAAIVRYADRQQFVFLSLDGSGPPKVMEDEEYKRMNAMADLAVSPTGEFLAVARGKRGVRTLELPSGKLSRDWPKVDFAVRSVSISDDGRRVLVMDGSAHVWEPATGLRLCMVADDKARLSADGKLLASVEHDGTIELWEVTSHRGLNVFPGHGAEVVDLQFSPDGKRLVTIAEDSTLLCWSLDSEDWPKAANQLANQPVAIDELWRQLGQREAEPAYGAARQMVERAEETLALLSARLPREIALPSAGKIDDADALRHYRAAYVLEQIEGETAAALRNRFRRDGPPRLGPFVPQADAAGDALPAGTVLRVQGEALLVSADGGTVLRGKGPQCCLCDPVTLQPVAPLPVTGRLNAVSRDGRFCVTKPPYGEHEVWEVATQTVLRTLGRHKIESRAVFHNDGRTLLTGTTYNELGAVDLLTGKSRSRSQKPYSQVRIAPDGRTLAACSPQNVWTILDAAFGKPLWKLPDSSLKAEPQYSTNGGYVAAPIDAGAWGIFEARTGRLWKRLPLEGRFLALSPRLATYVVAGDAKLRLYETATARPVWEFGQAASSVDYLPDGRRLVVRSPSGTMTVRDLGVICAKRQDGESAREQLSRLWPDLAGNDAERAVAAAFAYASAGDAAVDHLRAALQNHRLDRAEIRRLIQQLDDERYKVRANAAQKLIAQGALALGALNAALARGPSVETRLQIERIKASLAGGDGLLVHRRARMILDQIATPAAATLRAELQSELPELVDDDLRAGER